MPVYGVEEGHSYGERFGVRGEVRRNLRVLRCTLVRFAAWKSANGER